MISRMISGQSPQKVAVVGCGIAGSTFASELCVRHPTATCHIFDMGTRGPGERPGLLRADDARMHSVIAGLLFQNLAAQSQR